MAQDESTRTHAPTYGFRTLGCRLNQAETDEMAEQLSDAGFRPAPDDASPDVLIVNSCTVTQEATRSSRRAAKRAAEENPNSLVVVAGCYAVAEPAEASAIPGVGLVASNEDKERIASVVGTAMGSRHVKNGHDPLLQIGRRPRPERARANLKVQTGCDEYCTFCIIPFTRGSLRSYPTESLLTRARRLVDDGAREVVLTGVHLGKLGWDRGEPEDALIRLLEGLLEIDALARIRLSSILSRHVTSRLVSLVRDEPRLCRFFHIPLQSGSDRILERMNRPYRMDDYMDTVDLVRSEVSGTGITTDVIVGFPGESRADFELTLDAVERAGYLKLHVFRYSARPGTPSASFDDQVPEEEKKARSRELIALGNSIRRQIHENQEGASREVFVEESFASGDLSGHTDDFVKVTFPGDRSLVERLARVLIDEPGLDSVRGAFQREVPWDQADPRA